MMRRLFIEKVKKLIRDWAKQYPQVVLSVVEVYPSGIGDNFHVLVVAEKGFENWRKIERQQDIYKFLRKQLGDADSGRISALYAFTEEQHEKYEIIPAPAASAP